MSTTTTNYGLIKPGTDDPILIGQLNDNADAIDTVLKDHSDKIDAAALGIKYKGEVNYYADLPNSAKIGDAYTVKYAGSSGTTPDGTEYVWGAVSGTNQWINFSKDSYTKAEVDALLALKQNALSSTQLAAVNSGIDSTKVAQIETNKNNISSLNTDTALLKNTITTIRFSQGVTRTITFPRPNYNMFIVFGFVQGVGLVNWDCRSSNDGVLSVRDVLTASSVTQDTITYTRDLDAGTATVTISSNVNQWSYLTIIKNANIT